MGSSARIAKNTALLYIRMMVVMLINLYAVRVLLIALGEEDYGIYNVIAGVITMLSGISSVLAGATQRFYSYAMAEKKDTSLRAIFSTSINIYAVFSLIVLVLGETLGLWFINTQLVIPVEKMTTVNWIYQFSILSFILSMMQSPYASAVFAHEDMAFFAAISFSECVLKFGSALLLTVMPVNRLFFYGAMILVVHMFSCGSYIIIGRAKYPECRYKISKDKSLYKEILSFSGWNFFGSAAGVGMNQVNTLLVNIFFGPVVNAARAIAIQINGALCSFSESFVMAIRPPMVKAFAEKNYDYLNKLFTFSNKFIYYCLLLVAIPLIAEMETVLNIWLKSVPEQSVLFSQLIVVYVLILSINSPITIIMQAMGKVKEYYLPVESFTLLCPVITWTLFKLGFPAEASFYAMIGAISLSHLVRLFCLKKYYNQFSFRSYILSFLLPAAIITGVVVMALFALNLYIRQSIIRLLLSIVITVLLVFVLAYLLGTNSHEKKFLKDLLTRRRRKE